MLKFTKQAQHQLAQIGLHYLSVLDLYKLTATNTSLKMYYFFSYMTEPYIEINEIFRLKNNIMMSLEDERLTKLSICVDISKVNKVAVLKGLQDDNY
jgi:hypothetical protein